MERGKLSAPLRLSASVHSADTSVLKGSADIVAANSPGAGALVSSGELPASKTPAATVALEAFAGAKDMWRAADSATLDRPADTTASNMPAEPVALESPDTAALAKSAKTVASGGPADTVTLEDPADTSNTERPADATALARPAETIPPDGHEQSVALESPKDTTTVERAVDAATQTNTALSEDHLGISVHHMSREARKALVQAALHTEDQDHEEYLNKVKARRGA